MTATQRLTVLSAVVGAAIGTGTACAQLAPPVKIESGTDCYTRLKCGDKNNLTNCYLCCSDCGDKAKLDCQGECDDKWKVKDGIADLTHTELCGYFAEHYYGDMLDTHYAADIEWVLLNVGEPLPDEMDAVRWATALAGERLGNAITTDQGKAHLAAALELGAVHERADVRMVTMIALRDSQILDGIERGVYVEWVVAAMTTDEPLDADGRDADITWLVCVLNTWEHDADANVREAAYSTMVR